MKVIIIPNSEIKKFPILNIIGDSKWNPTNNTISGVYWLQLEAEQDLINNGVSYTIGEVEIKQEEIE